MQTQNATPAEKSIFSVTVNLNRQVTEQGLGFTSQVYRYAFAASPKEAELAAEAWLKSQGCDVRHAQPARLAAYQDVDTYTFPHQIINLPQELLDAYYDRRGYQPTWRNPARVVKVELLQ
jgi:hypothetical protein